jgi:flavin-dependent dehydrogenase
MSNLALTCDVVIAGAGPAGATLARLLASRGLDVVVVDPGRSATDRLEMVAPSSLPVFAAAGVAALLDDPAIALPCLGIRRRWGRMETQTDEFLRHPGGRGFTVDRSAFDMALRSMAEVAGAAAIAGRLCGARRVRSRTLCRIATGSGARSISARIAVDATGRSAALARRMGARHILHERLIAALNSRRATGDGQPWLCVDDDSDGWTYSLDGPGRQRQTWRVSRRAAGGGVRVNASAACLSDAAGAGWIAIGDAACAFDPIASQGLFHAVSTALVAAGIVLSTEGLTVETGSLYAGAVRATFAHTERGRAEVYRASKRSGAPIAAV